MNRLIIFIVVLTGIQTVVAAEYFSNTELQIHADFNRKPAESDILTVTVDHFSEWKYGDNFFFLDIEGKSDFATEADTLYFEYAPRLSLDNLFGNKIFSNQYLGELYATIQYNDSDRNFINQVWLYGVSIDFAGQPNYGFSNLHFLVREEDTQDTSYQITFSWGQPFRVGGWQFVFNGFVDYWEDDDKTVFLTEPQLRLPLANFVSQDNILAKAVIGTEIEISKDFFGKDYGWEINPTIFLTFPF
ncbi:DUF5020 family protein [Candidatus Halobeggiatoa sp. HSG11]|nr:DUF5020 family protein [Candidatus Halobeggiatoa sp. HSG11]